MTTIVFGGSGFIGRRLVSRLHLLGEEVISADLVLPPSEVASAASSRHISCDLRRFDEVVELLIGIRPQRSVNLAYMLGSEHPPHRAQQLNVIGMDNFFEASRLAQVDHVVFGSSLAVNGLQTSFGRRAVTEQDSLLGSTYQYATHKVFNEWQAADYRAKHGMRITSVRPANVAGHDKIFGSVDHVKCIVEPALGRAVRFPHADAMRCPVHVDDVAEAFARITGSTPDHEVYNTGGNTTSLGDLAKLVRSLIPGANIQFDAQAGARDGSTNYLIDNSRLRGEFDMIPMGLRALVSRVANDARAEHGLAPINGL